MLRRNRRTPNKTIGHGLKDCFKPSLNFLEEGRLVFGDASVACVVSRRYPDFWHHAGILYIGGCWFFQILLYVVPSVELVLYFSNKTHAN